MLKTIIVFVLIAINSSSLIGQNNEQKKDAMKMSNIRLLVADFEKSFAFYHETLGLKCTWGDKDAVFASFDIGLPSGLAIFKAELMAETIGNRESDSTDSQDKFVIVIEVDNVDDSFKNLKNKSISFITEPKNMAAWGIRVAHFRDPEGNLLEIFSNLDKGE